jgi:hypothetical protein
MPHRGHAGGIGRHAGPRAARCRAPRAMRDSSRFGGARLDAPMRLTYQMRLSNSWRVDPGACQAAQGATRTSTLPSLTRVS